MDAQKVGFSRRAFASLLDFLLMSMITLTALLWAYGRIYFAINEPREWGWLDPFLNYAFPIVFVLGFWLWRSATPGKMLLDMKIVDAVTGGKPSLFQYVIRYFAYYLSVIPLGLGLLWVLWDKDKQAWHDKIAKTLVVETDPYAELNHELAQAFP